MKRLFLLLFIPMLLLSAKTNDHKYYHSLSEIIYDSDTQKIKVNMKVFFDDLQQAIIVEQNKVINDPIDNYLESIDNYLDYHFNLIDANGNEVKLNLISTKDELDEVWFYFESEEAVIFSENWTVKNSLFIDLYPTQVNLVNFYPDKYNLSIVEGLLLNSVENEGSIQFNL